MNSAVAGFDWFTLVILCVQMPFFALFTYRILTPKYSLLRFVVWAELFGLAASAFQGLLLLARLPDALLIALLFIVELIGLFILFKLLSTDSAGKVLLTIIVLIVLLGFGSAMGALIETLLRTAVVSENDLFVRNWSHFRDILSVLFQGILLVVISGLYVNKMHKSIKSGRWSLFILGLLMQALTEVMMIQLLTWKNSSLTNVLMLSAFAALCLLADFYMMRTLYAMEKNLELTKQVSLLEQQKQLERSQYDAMSTQITNMRRLRHDYTNMLTTIGVLMDMGEKEKLRNILNDTAQMLADTRIVYTGNRVVDAVLYSKQLIAQEKGIKLSVSLLWPTTLTVSDTELMRIFSNLLDNAIRYCEVLPPEMPRKIEVTDVIQSRMMVFRFANTYLGSEPPVIPDDEVDPAALHGHGLAIVRSIAEAHGGALTAEVHGGMLTFHVLINLPQKTPPAQGTDASADGMRPSLPQGDGTFV